MTASASPDTPPEETVLSEDRIFSLLSMARRRELLRALAVAGGEATVGDMTNELAAAEHGDGATAKERKTIYVSLYQTHVPRLREAGVVTYDDHAKTVCLTDRAQTLLAYLRFDPQRRRPGLLGRFLGGRRGT